MHHVTEQFLSVPRNRKSRHWSLVRVERAEGWVCKLGLPGPPDKALGTGCCFVFTECPILGSLSILRDKDVNHYLDNLLSGPSSEKPA